MAGAYPHEFAVDHVLSGSARRDDGPSPLSPWPLWGGEGGEANRGLGVGGRARSPPTDPLLEASARSLPSVLGDRPGALGERGRTSPAALLAAAPPLTAGAAQARHNIEQLQTELFLQSRRQDEMFERVSRLEADLGRVAKLAAENEDLHSEERQQRHGDLANVTRRTEDALLTTEALRKNQEQLIQRLERLEALGEEREPLAEQARALQHEVDALQGVVRDKLDTFGHALRRLDAAERIFDENTRLRQEVALLRRANERRDLEMAAVQGQIDALTKLVREQMRDPLSPPKELSAVGKLPI